MPNYLILYRSTMPIGEQMAGTPEDMEASMAAWMAWGAAAGPASRRLRVADDADQ